ncbi:MAG: hypothetical protein ABI850_14595 [Flavobacterium sp.]
MNKYETKEKLKSLVIAFLNSTKLEYAIEIKKEIYDIVLICPYTENIQKIVNDSIKRWDDDLSNYLTTFESKDKFYTRQAYLALTGIINLVDISLLPD